MQISFHSFQTNLSLHAPGLNTHVCMHTHIFCLVAVLMSPQVWYEEAVSTTKNKMSITTPQHKNCCHDHYGNYKVTELHTLDHQLLLHFLNMTVPSSISHDKHKVSFRYQESGCKYQFCIYYLIRVNILIKRIEACTSGRHKKIQMNLISISFSQVNNQLQDYS